MCLTMEFDMSFDAYLGIMLFTVLLLAATVVQQPNHTTHYLGPGPEIDCPCDLCLGDY